MSDLESPRGGLVLDGSKILLPEHRDRLLAYLRGEKVVPITVDCALASVCNQRCMHCYANLQTGKNVILPRDVVMRFLDDAARMGVKAVSFVSDGESGRSPYCREAILHGKQNGLDMAIATNGTWLNEEILNNILPALTYLRITINAGEPERYSQIHGGGAPKPQYKRKLINDFNHVCVMLKKAMEIKKKGELSVTVGMQMVLQPHYADQIMPLTRLAVWLGVDYLVIKHCSDDEIGTLGVEYAAYAGIEPLLREAEALSNDRTIIAVKWSKIRTGNKRTYRFCLGAPLHGQYSGTGLVAPCGMLFNSKFKEFHVGNIQHISYASLLKGKEYWNVMQKLAQSSFDPRKDCGSLCLQHKTNEALWSLMYDTTGDVLRKRTLPEIESILSRINPDDAAGVIHRNFI